MSDNHVGSFGGGAQTAVTDSVKSRRDVGNPDGAINVVQDDGSSLHSRSTGRSATGSNNESDEHRKKQEALRKLNISFAIHMLIPLYGVVIVVAVIVNKLL